MSSTIGQFYDTLTTAIPGDAMPLLASKFPTQGMQSFEYDSKSAKFKIVYEDQYVGRPQHLDEVWNKSFEGVTVTVNNVVTGKINSKSKTVEFDSGSFTATVPIKTFVGSTVVNVALTKFKDRGDGQVDVTGKLGLSKTRAVAQNVIMDTIIDWMPASTPDDNGDQPPAENTESGEKLY